LKIKPILNPVVRPAYGYNSQIPLSTLGKFKAKVKIKDRIVDADFVVMKGNGGCLLGYETSKSLKIISIINSVDNVVNSSKQLESLKNKYPFFVASCKILKKNIYLLKFNIYFKLVFLKYIL
jgi:hypothetical protein